MNEKPHEYKIMVNGQPKVVHQDVLNYTQIVLLAYPTPPSGPNVDFAVTYKHAASFPHQGDLAAGGSVTVKNGTIFDVTPVNRS
jgi:hypothetical protein